MPAVGGCVELSARAQARTIAHMIGSIGSSGVKFAMQFLLIALLMVTSSHAQESFILDESDDAWKQTDDFDPSSERGQLLVAERAIALGEPARARRLAVAWLEKYPLSPYRARGLLVKGDALLALGDEYKALFAYEEIARRYPGSDSFVPALQRELQIATEYANGLRKKFLGTFRLLDASDDAQELLIRIQQRLPGSELAEQAAMTLADFYFKRGEMTMAAEMYDIFLKNFPRSRYATRARLRLIYSFLASFKGPQFDGKGLSEARLRLEDLQVQQPSLAQKVGSEAMLVGIYESEAEKLLSTSLWYKSTDNPISAEQVIRRLITDYPDSIAAMRALEIIPGIIARMPQSVVMQAPDYAALRVALLGIDPEQQEPLRGISPAREQPLPVLVEPEPKEMLEPVQDTPGESS